MPGVGIILVGVSRCLRQIPWLRLVEVAPARFLLSIPSGTPVELLEIALDDLREAVPPGRPRASHSRSASRVDAHAAAGQERLQGGDTVRGHGRSIRDGNTVRDFSGHQNGVPRGWTVKLSNSHPGWGTPTTGGSSSGLVADDSRPRRTSVSPACYDSRVATVAGVQGVVPRDERAGQGRGPARRQVPRRA